MSIFKLPRSSTTKSRQALGKRRMRSLMLDVVDPEAWVEPPWPSPSYGPGTCEWCGGELRDAERTHCDIDEGCYWQWCVDEMDRRRKAGRQIHPGGKTWTEMGGL